jgi:FkbM family methyltransferase
MRLQTLKNGEQIYTHNKGEYISDIIEQTGWYYEPKTIEYIKSLNLSNCCIIDIGANIGNHSHAINYFTNNCYLISIEPFNENYEILKLNNIEGTCLNWFIDSPVNQHCIDIKISPIWGENNLGYIKRTSEGQLINKIGCIDSILTDSAIKLIKIDVEGNELHALAGAKFTLKEFHPCIIAEHHTIAEHYKVLEYLKQFGYKLERIIEEDNLNYVYTV